MYTRVESRFWQDEKMINVSCEARYLMLYLLTSPHRNVLGFYFLPEPYACFDLGWTQEQFRERLGELLRNGLVKYDETAHVVLIINFLKHNPLENQNQVKSAIEKLNEIPKTPLFKDFYEAVKKYSYGKSHYSSLLERLEKLLQEQLPKQLDEQLEERYGKQEKEKEEEKEKEYIIKSDYENPTPPASVSVESTGDEKNKNKADNIQEIFDHWNSKNIIVHRNMTDKIKRSIKSALKDYKQEEICKAIDNYATILSNSDKYFWSYKWGLREFLQRGIDKFLDFEIAASNYARDNNKPRGDPKYGPAGPQKNFNNRDINSYDFDKFYANLEVDKDE